MQAAKNGDTDKIIKVNFQLAKNAIINPVINVDAHSNNVPNFYPTPNSICSNCT